MGEAYKYNFTCLNFDQIKQTQIEDVCATSRRTKDVDPLGQNCQVSELPLGHADVRQIVQYLQFSSRRSGMGGKKKGILRTSPRLVVMALACCLRSRVDFRRTRPSLCFDDTNLFSSILA